MFIPGIDEDVEMESQTPQGAGFVPMDDAFENIDYAIDEAETFTKRSSADDADTILMQLPRGKVARVSKQRFKACKSDSELRELDRQIYVSTGLNPGDYGI